MSAVVGFVSEKDAPVRERQEEGAVIPDELRLRLLRAVEGALQSLTKIDADYLTAQDSRRLGSAIDRQLELEAQLSLALAKLELGVRLSRREKLVLLHIRRRGRVMRSTLLRALSRYRITAAALSAAVAPLIRAGIVAEHREIASNGGAMTIYSVVPKETRP